MGISVGSQALNISAIKNKYFVNPQRVQFAGSYDSFQREGVNEASLRSAINTNPEIKKILSEINVPAKLNMKVLNNLVQGHANDTRDIVSGIIDNLPKALRQEVDVKSVREAAYLHDVGKALIPENILNKEGKLNAKEEEIMHRHSELSYELLKSCGIHPNTLELVKYHHQNSSHTGYPKVPAEFIADINLQILSLADRYSALTEARPYKEAYSREKALGILYKDVKSGDIHPFVFKALVNSVGDKKAEKSSNAVV